METRKNALAAIAAAVQLYIQAQQPVAAPAEEYKAAPTPGPAYSLWSIAGRQAAMEMRRSLQMRYFR